MYNFFPIRLIDHEFILYLFHWFFSRVKYKYSRIQYIITGFSKEFQTPEIFSIFYIFSILTGDIFTGSIRGSAIYEPPHIARIDPSLRLDLDEPPEDEEIRMSKNR